MSYDGNIAPAPHRLKVIGYVEAIKAHRCEINGRTVFVDVMVDGTIPSNMAPDDLIGLDIDVDCTHGYIFIATNPRVAGDDPALSKASGKEA